MQNNHGCLIQYSLKTPADQERWWHGRRRHCTMQGQWLQRGIVHCASAVCTAMREGHLEHLGSGLPRWRCRAAAARSAPALHLALLGWPLSAAPPL